MQASILFAGYLLLFQNMENYMWIEKRNQTLEEAIIFGFSETLVGEFKVE